MGGLKGRIGDETKAPKGPADASSDSTAVCADEGLTLEAQLASVRARQIALSKVSQLALSSAAPEEFSNDTTDLICEAMRAEAAAIFQLSPDHKVLKLEGGAGWPRQMLQLRSLPTAVCRPLYASLSSDAPTHFLRSEFNIILEGQSLEGRGVALPIGDRAARSGVLVVFDSDENRWFRDGEISFLQTIAFIVSAVWERRQSESLLLLRNQALEALDQGVMITDARRLDNPLIYVNPAFERLTGYSATDVLGKNPRFLRGEDTDPNTLSTLRTASESGKPFRDMIKNYRKNGEAFWNDLAISSVLDEQGRPTHNVGILSDVSERVRLEAQLHQAQKMEAIGHLTGGIAHDFNNLLAVILGNLDIVFEETENAELKSTIEMVMQTAERGAVLTQRLLAFGRRQALHPESINLGEAVASLADMLQRTLGEQVRLSTPAPDQSYFARVDRAMFESAILNLAVNARDAMPEGGTLEIAVDGLGAKDADEHDKLEATDYAHVSVKDTGTGIPPELVDKVFEPFFTTKEVGRGSGLGLAMVYGFAKQSGGHVGVQSALGEGTIVNLYLPLAEARQTVDETVSARLTVPKGSEHILIVEDEENVRRFVSHALTRLGYSVTEAPDAKTALSLLKTANKIDLLFSDLILPGGNSGLKLVEHARKLRPDLRVLLTTGYTEEYERLSTESDAQILRKPYRRNELALTVRTVLDAA